MSSLSVSESFYSIQGEGSTMGRPSVFLRLAGCNLMCGGQGTQFDEELHNGATWRCDTLEVWTKGRSKKFEEVLSEDLVDRLKQGANLIVTGGEPLMQQKRICLYLDYLKEIVGPDLSVEIETNGTIMPSQDLIWHNVQFNCSPKLANSGNDKDQYFVPNVIQKINKANSIFKFVVGSTDDWSEIESLYLEHMDRKKIWIMPAGENQDLLEQSKPFAVEVAIENCVNYSTRIHIDIWNKKTGV